MNDIQQAEDYGWKRALIFVLMGLVLLLGLLPALHGGTASEGQLAFGIPAYWLRVLITVMSGLLIATGGGLLKPSPVLALANDETVRANRRTSMIVGFWAMLATGLLGYLSSFGDHAPTMRLMTRLVIDIGEAAALLAFAALEIRAYRRG